MRRRAISPSSETSLQVLPPPGKPTLGFLVCDHEGFDKFRRDLRDDCVAISFEPLGQVFRFFDERRDVGVIAIAHKSHSSGKPIKNLGSDGFNRPSLSVAALDPAAVVPEVWA
jgi:hypothetical protein